MYFQTITNSPALHAQVIRIKHSHSVSWEISVWNWFSSRLNLENKVTISAIEDFLVKLTIYWACHSFPPTTMPLSKWYSLQWKMACTFRDLFIFNLQSDQNFRGFHWDYYSFVMIANCLSSVRWGIIISDVKLY